ncbi:MAG: NUDIX hydrolase [Clostridiales bacterium]|nr:NUDIX hydrolase [Clostridiales bacterium]
MDLTERKIDGDYKYFGKLVKIRLDSVRLPDGKTSTREVCEHVEGVAVLPINDKGEVVMVRQFRYPFEEALLEIPAGKMDNCEEGHYNCGLRELREETGIVPKEFHYLGCIYPSPGFLTEVIHLYLAKGLKEGAPCPDEDEYLSVETVPFEELKRMIADNIIRDAKTIAAVFRASMLLS